MEAGALGCTAAARDHGLCRICVFIDGQYNARWELSVPQTAIRPKQPIIHCTQTQKETNTHQGELVDQHNRRLYCHHMSSALIPILLVFDCMDSSV